MISQLSERNMSVVNTVLQCWNDLQCLSHLSIHLIRSLGFNFKQLKYFVLSVYKHETPIFHYSHALHLILYVMETLFFSVTERTCFILLVFVNILKRTDQELENKTINAAPISIPHSLRLSLNFKKCYSVIPRYVWTLF